MATAKRSIEKGTKRDVSLALLYVQTLRNRFDPSRTDKTFTALESTLRNLDARTGKREPHLRRARTATKSAKRPAKRAKKVERARR